MIGIQECVKTAREGGVILVPTDTNYALACDPFNEKACARLYEIKQRPPEKPLTLFVASVRAARRYLDLSSPEDSELFGTLTSTYWPGALNIIGKSSSIAPTHRYFDSRSISIAFNRQPVLNQLLEHTGVLAMTSANISGTTQEALISFQEAFSLFGEEVDACIPEKEILAPVTSISSTIVRINDGLPSTVRQGDIKIFSA